MSREELDFFHLTKYTKIKNDFIVRPVVNAVTRMQRDLCFTLEEYPAKAVSEETEIRLCTDDTMQEEEFEITFPSNQTLQINAGDELGFVYALLFLSKEFLGVKPFWFWNDQIFHKKKEVLIPLQNYHSSSYAVKMRGWFVNDEVLLHKWSIEGSESKPWEMVFEALLRCGGNMVIPGTDKTTLKYRKLASDMGLWITQHHAEPLGAEMFSRVYPDLNPSFKEYPELFRGLWKKGIESQKQMKVVWNLGFRGQGDCPFWVNDPQYATDETRGELLSSLIEEQYHLVKESNPEARCCTNLYGETMELFKKGLLNLPEDVIKIWADNGYGKMVSRRQGNHNPRINSEPIPGEGNQGIYYHVSFYDLQAANHITMLPNSSEFVKSELENVLNKGANYYWIVNSSNVKPHIYFLDFISKLWKTGKVEIREQQEEFEETYYDASQANSDKKHMILDCINEYEKSALSYGTEEDERAGEQFSNHVTRMLASQWLTNSEEATEELFWAKKCETLKEQIKWYHQLCTKGSESYAKLNKKYEVASLELDAPARELFKDSFLLQAQIYYLCYKGATYFCEGYFSFINKEYQRAFFYVGKAAESYEKANLEMREREHGKWKDFYQNECLTDIKQTAWILHQLMGFIRNIGDGPHFYKWKRDFLYSEEDRRVMLVLVMENHITNENLFALMKAKWDQ